jgi:chromosome segregation ATPase
VEEETDAIRRLTTELETSQNARALSEAREKIRREKDDIRRRIAIDVALNSELTDLRGAVVTLKSENAEFRNGILEILSNFEQTKEDVEPIKKLEANLERVMKENEELRGRPC